MDRPVSSSAPPRNAQRSRVVVFDFDGTLADSWRDIAAALHRTLDAFGLRLAPGTDVRAWIGDGAMKLIERAVPEADRTEARLAEIFEVFRAHYDACCLDTTVLYPGMESCLDALAGERLAVLSNKPARFLDRIVAGLGIGPRFHAVLGGDSLSVRKPDPRVLHELLERIGGAADEVWIVGDSAVDVRTGQAAGARTIGCAWGLRGREELRDAGVDVLVEHPGEIPPLVLGLGEGA